MFHCVILFRLKPGIPLERVRGARVALQSLVETMPGVAHLTVTHNLAAERQGFNLALFSLFETRNACEIFFRHPEYQRVWDTDLAPVIEHHVMAQGEGDAD
jgi:heme-degrading monooxygenase HmoA